MSTESQAGKDSGRKIFLEKAGNKAESLMTIGLNPKHVGGKLGILAVLHTWTRALEHHPHVHMLVPAGGLDSD